MLGQGTELRREIFRDSRPTPRGMRAQYTLFSAHVDVQSARVESNPLMWPRSARGGASPKMASFASNRPNVS